MGAPAGRDRARDHYGWRRGPFLGARRDRSRPRGGGPDRGERRHREQDRHVREGRRRKGERRPILRCRADEHDRHRLGIRGQDPDRRTIAAGGPPSRRATHRAEGESGAQSILRRHAGQVHHRNHHRAGNPETLPTPPVRARRSEEKSPRLVSVGGYAFTDRPVSPRAMLLVTTWFGSFLLDAGTVVEKRLFPMEPGALADRLVLVEDWKVLAEERDLMSRVDEAFVIETRLERAGGNRTTVRPPFLKPEDFGYGRDLLHAAMVELAKRRMRKAIGPEDHLRQAVGALDELQEEENVLVERLREGYGLHFPELAPMVDPATYVELVSMHGRRERMPIDHRESVGADLPEREEAELKALAGLAKLVADQRRAVEAYVERSIRELAPNVSELAGPIIAARLVTLAGGVDDLARAPAGTVQLLGAERALFRHLRTGSRPPKHGVLFQHPWVHGAPPWQRGAIARAFAAKISLAARADAFTKRKIAPDLLKKLEVAIEEIRRRRANKPARPKRPAAPKNRAHGRRTRR